MIQRPLLTLALGLVLTLFTSSPRWATTGPAAQTVPTRTPVATATQVAPAPTATEPALPLTATPEDDDEEPAPAATAAPEATATPIAPPAAPAATVATPMTPAPQTLPQTGIAGGKALPVSVGAIALALVGAVVAWRWRRGSS